MGLKSGSRDAGLDDEEEDDEHIADAEPAQPETESEATNEPVATERTTTDATETAPDPMPETTSDPTEPPTEPQTERELASPASDSGGSDGRPEMSSIPYKMRREKVNEGRDQVPFFLRQKVIDAEDDLQDALEAQLGEDVYKSDYREAAMVVAQRNPELVAEVLREWGYDLK